MWLICIACHHAAEVKKLAKKARIVCRACGSHVARAVRVVKWHMLNGGQMPPDFARKSTHAGLISIARARGYSDGWAAHKYRAIFDEWPPREIPEPINPSTEMLWWIRKQNIAYAKARDAAGEARKPQQWKLL